MQSFTEITPYNPNSNGRLTISKWAPEDKPREKLLSLGPRALTDAELLTIFIGYGTPTKTAFDLAKELLAMAHNKLDVLAKCSINQMCSVSGIGQAKAITIKAAIEFAGRIGQSEPNLENKIKDSNDIFLYFRKDLFQLEHEEFWIVILDSKLRPILKKRISSGVTNFVPVDVKEIGRLICDHKGFSMACVHNHPSGTMEPSPADIILTEKLKHLCPYFDCKFIDHLIISNNQYYSFSDRNML